MSGESRMVDRMRKQIGRLLRASLLTSAVYLPCSASRLRFITFNRRLINQVTYLLCFSLWCVPLFAGQNTGAQTNTDAMKSLPDSSAAQIVSLLDFKNTDLRDVLRGLGAKYGLNVFVDDRIDQRITVHLVKLPVSQVFEFIAEQYGLTLTRQGAIYRFDKPDAPEQLPEPLNIRYENELLSLSIKNIEIVRFVSEITQVTGKNVLLDPGVTGSVSGVIEKLPFHSGLQAFMSSNGFEVRKVNDVFFIAREVKEIARNGGSNGKAHGQKGGHFSISVHDSLVTLEATDASIIEVLQELLRQCGKDVVIYNEVKGQITANYANVRFEDALDYLLKGTEFSYRKEDSVYMVGGRNLQGIVSSRLIRLKHLRVEEVPELIPEYLKQTTHFKLVKEHNGIVAIGTSQAIAETASFLDEIDRPIAQVLIEALVVDIKHDNDSEFSIYAGVGASNDSSNSTIFNLLFPDLDISGTGRDLNEIQSKHNHAFGLTKILRLPEDFFFNIRALEREHILNIRSRPQIATLNGHSASISIGTTQYFKLNTVTPLKATTEIVTQVSERFETIKAEMVLEVTPWVTATGEIITEIHPEFSTPKGNLSADVPPTIDHRVLDSTIKLKDGETIVLGGLIQEFETESRSKFPILGDIPLLGKLFRNRLKSKTKAELIIYLTPHIYYIGGEPPSSYGRIE